MRLALVDMVKKSIIIYDNKIVLAKLALESGDIGMSKEFIEEIRTAEYKDRA